MDKKQIDRINELARKKKAEGLTPEETAEQAALRAQYIAEWRENTRAMLDGIVIQRPDGTTEPLKKKNPPVKH
ncbi:MAG: DUF896 domain-containing protein [Clostridia bacterium]|nr:DUF896 domain-containing protein [Clostridia bacterium]